MASKKGEKRLKITVQSTAGTGFRYITEKNRMNHPDRLVVRKYDPRVRMHVDFKEIR